MTQRIVSDDPDSIALDLDLLLRNPAVETCNLHEAYQDQSGKLCLNSYNMQLFFGLDRDYDAVSANAIDYPVSAIRAKNSHNDLYGVRNIMKDLPLTVVRHSKYLAGVVRALDVPYF